jgi:hypothetical protein
MEDDQMVFLMVEDSERDQFKAYHLRANANGVKPMNFENPSEAIRSINAFWQLAGIPDGTK